MILHEIQDHHGYVPRSLAKEVARELNIPLARIWEVLTFYNLFKLAPPGKNVTSVCMGTACYLKGAQGLLETFKQKLNVGAGETTADGLFHLQGVRCLGCCGLAPVTMVNGKIYPKLRQNDVQNIIDDCTPDGRTKPQ
jgi:NADH-quinone oxidoreductase subunit E